MTLFGREYIMMAHHDTRRFVEKVDFISGVGYPGGLAGRHELGLETGGPELVFTPKCIFDFDKTVGHMRVKSIHPGITHEDLQACTGFDLRSEEHTSELQSLMRISYAVFCLK